MRNKEKCQLFCDRSCPIFFTLLLVVAIIVSSWYVAYAKATKNADLQYTENGIECFSFKNETGKMIFTPDSTNYHRGFTSGDVSIQSQCPDFIDNTNIRINGKFIGQIIPHYHQTIFIDCHDQDKYILNTGGLVIDVNGSMKDVLMTVQENGHTDPQYYTVGQLKTYIGRGYYSSDDNFDLFTIKNVHVASVFLNDNNWYVNLYTSVDPLIITGIVSYRAFADAETDGCNSFFRFMCAFIGILLLVVLSLVMALCEIYSRNDCKDCDCDCCCCCRPRIYPRNNDVNLEYNMA
ncbi:MAG: hypothetical protein Dasosvirus1_30 [Dasosvirus sp.]|uniref:Uncharacterized protein n=1 Tax=Dasosvirus sp. TaxID=2487764 RepID=A0A3G4ZR97_9VIRU|nr:MAG: hypothetical protein Dasosvirus1_30 [Dasosvirus sp.]